MFKVRFGFSKCLILFISVMSLFTFLGGVKSCQRNNISITELTFYEALQLLVPLVAFLMGIAVLRLKQKYKSMVERILCHQTIGFTLLSMGLIALIGFYEALVGDTMRTFEAVVLNFIGGIAGVYYFVIWLYSFVLVDRLRKGSRLEWNLGLMFFGIIVTPIAVHYLVPENISKHLKVKRD